MFTEAKLWLKHSKSFLTFLLKRSNNLLLSLFPLLTFNLNVLSLTRLKTLQVKSLLVVDLTTGDSKFLILSKVLRKNKTLQVKFQFELTEDFAKPLIRNSNADDSDL